MDIAESRNTLRLSTVDRLKNASIPSDLRYNHDEILKAAREVDRIVAKYQEEANRVTSNADFTQEARTRQLNELNETATSDINFQASLVDTFYKDAVNTYEGLVNAEPSVSDVMLQDASTRLHFMARQQKYVSESTFVDIYQNAIEDGDTALSELVRKNYKSIVRQYTGNAAKHPERFVSVILGDRAKEYKNALKVMDVSANLRQAAMYQLS